MGGGRWHPRSCRLCGALVEQVGHISATGLCPPCGRQREIDNHEQLREHAGPFFQHWRSRCLAAFGVSAAASEQAEQ